LAIIFFPTLRKNEFIKIERKLNILGIIQDSWGFSWLNAGPENRKSMISNRYDIGILLAVEQCNYVLSEK
jgi:hypothetical protein